MTVSKMSWEVHAVVLNWNNFSDTNRCVSSLKSVPYNNLHIWIVDNGSTDGSLERLQDQYEKNTDVSFLSIEYNIGFGGGMNRGIEAALDEDADAIFLLNNDTVFPQEDIISPLIEKLREYPSLGAISPIVKRLRKEGESRGASSVTMMPKDHFNRRRNHFQSNIYDPDLNYGVSYSACLFTSEALNNSGLFSEEYFMYVEDIEHALSVEEAGYQRATHTGVAISHEFHGSTDPHGVVPAYYKARNWLLLHRKRTLEPRKRFLFWYLYFIVTRWIHRLVTLNTSSLIGLTRGVIDGLKGRTGKGPYP